MHKQKPKILTFTGCYLPGFKGGGPIRTIASMVAALGDELDFKIVTLDRDFGSDQPYNGIQKNYWHKVGKAEVFYVAPENLNWISLHRIINTTSHDILYLNSFFSPKFTIIPMVLRRFGLLSNAVTIIAPRGEFSSGALKLKSFKKRVFIKLAILLRLYRDVVWQVSSAHEKKDLFRVFENSKNAISLLAAVIAPDLTDIMPLENVKTTSKEPGGLKIIFLSRISPKKNLDGALQMITGLQGRITFNIFGPIEDTVYWENCQRIIEKLPDNIEVNYKGMVDHNEVICMMAAHDLFFLPTHGENFGHVIVEALVAGCPILISDQTPWRDLEKDGVGWDLSLDHPERFTVILQRCADMTDTEFSGYSSRAREYALKKTMDENAVKQNRDLFLNAI